MSSRQCKFFLYIIYGEATEAQRAEVVKRFLKNRFWLPGQKLIFKKFSPLYYTDTYMDEIISIFSLAKEETKLPYLSSTKVGK